MYIILLVFLSLFPAALANTVTTPGSQKTETRTAQTNWKNFVAKLKNPEQEVRVVFLGDSITEKNFCTRGKSNYVDYLNAYFISHNPRTNIKNAGKSGDTTRKALARLQQDVLEFKPDLTFVMLGINDCSSWFNVPLEEYKQNLKNIITQLLNNNSAVIVMTQNEFLPNPYDGKVTFTDYEKFAAAAIETATSLKVRVIDNLSRWQKLKKEQPEKFKSYMYDWIHPNEEGHIFYYLGIKQELDKILLNISDKWEFGAWAVFGLFGQTLFFSRFLIQWLVSEKKKKSVIPLSFWYLSLFGSIIVLIYAIQKKDIVFTLAMAFGFTVYTRNLIFIYREKLKGKANSQALLNEE